MRCNRHDCGLGEIDDEGFCTVCSLPALVEDEIESLLESVRSSTDRIRPDPWWGLDLVHASTPPRAPTPTAEPVPGPDPDLANRTIAGRYDVTRRVGAGLSGTSYLVHDRNLGAEVVLKALTNESKARRQFERDVLVGLRHDSIVRLLGYEPEGPYLVLEYVPGAPVSSRDRATPLEIVLGHGIQILQALDYLHGRGLLHCDVKPSNIIRFREATIGAAHDRVRLIDFGAVRIIGSPGRVTIYTGDYAPPDDDPERTERPTAGFDLFCLGKTLLELCHEHLDRSATPGVDSLKRLLSRATDTDTPRRRFASARQLAEQLSGVIRQVVAPRTIVDRDSTLFGPMTESLHGGLGAPRPLEHWIRAAVTDDRRMRIAAGFATPSGFEIVGALPAPLSDPEDTTTVGAVEVRLDACRHALNRGAVVDAKRALHQADLADWHWLHAWYTGLIAMAGEDWPAATASFAVVWDMLPGEMIPRLALGLCAELSGETHDALSHYETVVGMAPEIGAAAYGLARVRLHEGQRDKAVEAIDRLTPQFRFEREAHVAAVRLFASSIPDNATRPDPDLAWQRYETLALSGLPDASLRAEVQVARFDAGRDPMALVAAVRELATYATSESAHTALLDLSYLLRPPVVWKWTRPWTTQGEPVH